LFDKIEAERGYVPNIFTTRSKFGTPTAGIIFNTIVIIAFSCADFGQLLELLNSVYAMALLMEYAAFVKLRLYHKDCTFLQSALVTSFFFIADSPNYVTYLSPLSTVHRPYRIPVPDWAAILIVIPPTLGIGFIFATSNWYVYVFCAAALLLGFSLSKLSKVSKSRGWCAYKSKDNNYEKTPSDIPESMEGTTTSPRLYGHHNDGEWEYSNEDALFEIGDIS
jgi:hypothetical protein